LLGFSPEQVSCGIGDAWDPKDFSDCGNFHLNEFLAASGMLGIPEIGGIMRGFTHKQFSCSIKDAWDPWNSMIFGISTLTSFLWHQGCLGSQQFEGFLGFPHEQDF
jgi:hypothetical protein